MTNFDIQQFLDLSNYATETRKARRKSKEVNSQEFFTPYDIVKTMCEKISDEDWSDPYKTFLEPCAGNFQFVIYMIYNRLQHGIDWKTALKTCYGVELLEDNLAEGKQRLHTMLSHICPDYNKASATRIMNKNFVCHDFFTWNFEEWRPMTEEEIKKAKKR